jgi:hypothetical protein
MIESSFLLGWNSSNLSVGGSVAKASAARESIIKLIQSISTALKMV